MSDRDEARRLALAHEQGRMEGRNEVLVALARVLGEERPEDWRTSAERHTATVIQEDFMRNRWGLSCSCGHSETDLSLPEADGALVAHRGY